MPTPTRAFAELAAKHGGVDPDDMEAVQRWYEETVPTLSPAMIEKILEELLSSERLEVKGESPRVYPADAPLPALDQAPPVPLPLLAAGWREFLRRLLRRHGTRDTIDT
jgi:hypothetical protein